MFFFVSDNLKEMNQDWISNWINHWIIHVRRILYLAISNNPHFIILFMDLSK